MASETPITFLYTDLVKSTELLQRVGDEQARLIFDAHHQLLRQAIAEQSGREVKWQGDGVMAAFASSGGAVRCAVSIQQSARRAIQGERLQVRVGLNVGEALDWEEEDYFGTPVVLAARLVDEAEAGQILCSSVLPVLLSGRQAFQFKEVGELNLQGIPEPFAVCEVLYEEEQPEALLRHTPFVGRQAEGERLNAMVQEARGGRGGLVMLVGEPGIGKTRMAEELAAAVQGEGGTVMWGRCYEGEWAPPYGPFAEAIESYTNGTDLAALGADLGNGAGSIARLVPKVRDVLPDIPEPPALQPDEERFRLLDAVTQFLIAASKRTPLVLVLDDLHWADRGTIAMLRHVARFVANERLLLVGAYRDVELDRQHPLADALGALRRETNFERILLKGLETSHVSAMLSTLAEDAVPDALVEAISAETDGNPFFIREVLLHLMETGALVRRDGGWANDIDIEELGIPEGVRQVIGRRLSRLSEPANRLLTAASAFNAGFQFSIITKVADLDEPAALDAIDEALEAQILRPGGAVETYDFVHASIRHTLYGELNPSRQVRLHRRVAEAMEEVYGAEAAEHAPEIAYQYHRSAALPGGERGVEHAVAAADKAEDAYAHDDVATFLNMALELLPGEDARRIDLLARLGLALPWTLDFDGAAAAANEAADLIAEARSRGEAADYLADVSRALMFAGAQPQAWALAERGLEFVGDRRDSTWTWLASLELLRREAEDPDDPGIPLDSPERREISKIVKAMPVEERRALFIGSAESRDEALQQQQEVDPEEGVGRLIFLIGDYQRGLAGALENANQGEREGRIAGATASWAFVARCQNALGNFPEGGDAYVRARDLAARLVGTSFQTMQVGAALFEAGLAIGVGFEQGPETLKPILEQRAPEGQWALANARSIAAAMFAKLGRKEEALRWLETLIPPIERAPGWMPNYTAIVCDAAAALWSLERTDHVEVIERNLREKVITPDFRYPMRDGRQALARLSALQGRYEEAAEWFEKARAVLDEQGARPLRAIVDFDEAVMYRRRAEQGDAELAAPLLEAALEQFRELGMTGWTERAEELQKA